jgi:hypothetical protein
VMITSIHKAIDLMRTPGARLIQTNGRSGPQWWIAPSGARIDPKVAEQLKEHSQVKGDEDCMFPGLSQTHRMR